MLLTILFIVIFSNCYCREWCPHHGLSINRLFHVSVLAPKNHVCDQYNVGKMAIRVYQAVSEIGFLLKPLGNFSPM